MRVRIKLEIHAYESERLCDECFDDAPGYGLYGPEGMLPLVRKRNSEMVFDYNERSTINDMIESIEGTIWGDSAAKELVPTTFTFLVGTERYIIADGEHNFNNILSKYIDTNGTGAITVCILVCCDAGTVGREGPLRYFVHSRESGSHHEAHIHVCDKANEYEASVRISDGEVIAGELPSKYAKMAKAKILSDQEYFYKCWNTMTDGLRIDINHHYGIIDY